MLTKFRILSALCVLSPILQAFARQIPIIDGVVGGVPSAESLAQAEVVTAAITPAATTPGKLRVTENSGVCETTPGVYQASGYGDLTSNESIW